jgi:hypothetical protein
VSAPHALKDVKVFFFVRHADLRNQLTRGKLLADELMRFNYELIPENPTFCDVMDSVAAFGIPSPSTSTRMRAKMRHDSADQIT